MRGRAGDHYQPDVPKLRAMVRAKATTHEIARKLGLSVGFTYRLMREHANDLMPAKQIYVRRLRPWSEAFGAEETRKVYHPLHDNTRLLAVLNGAH